MRPKALAAETGALGTDVTSQIAGIGDLLVACRCQTPARITCETSNVTKRFACLRLLTTLLLLTGALGCSAGGSSDGLEEISSTSTEGGSGSGSDRDSGVAASRCVML